MTSIRHQLPDHASEPDDRRLAIDRVGIKGLLYPITVWDQTRQLQHTVATVDMFVTLPRQFKGTHMSRFVEVLEERRGEVSLGTIDGILTRLQDRLEAREVHFRFAFPYFVEKRAPVSGVASLMSYDCAFEASKRNDVVDFVLEVTVPVKSLCPCSKSISDYGAHNQRSLVTVAIRSTEFVWIEQVVTVVEGCASAPLYALLKREDEKHVTEQAYDNPRFVEDLVRDIVIEGQRLPGVQWMKVTAENQESIHNHAAFAEIEWSEAEAVSMRMPPERT